MRRFFRFISFLIVCHFGLSASAEMNYQIPAGKVSVADNEAFAAVNFDDSGWAKQHWSLVEEKGVWWTRSVFTLPQENANNTTPLGLYIHAVGSSEVWIDGKRIGQNGLPSDNAEDELPGLLSSVFPLPANIQDGQPHLIAVRLSSQHSGSKIRSPLDALYIGPYGSPLGWQKRGYAPTIVTLGAIGLATVFLIIMAVAVRSRRSYWLLAASFFALVQMLFEVARAFVNYPYTWHVARLMSISICACITAFCIVAYLADRFDMGFRRFMLWLLGLLFITMLIWIPQSDLVSMMASMVIVVAGLIMSAIAKKVPVHIRVLTAVALLLFLTFLVINPMIFIDRYYYFGITALLLLFFLESVVNHTKTTRQLSQALTESTRLRLELLKQYLRPHYLLNTLTALSEWFEEDQKIGHRMVQVLSEELRLLEQCVDKKLISIDEELHLCRLHLELFGYRQDHQYQLKVKGSYQPFLIPPAVVHTLLENALSHNAYENELTTFELSIEEDQQRVMLRLKTPLMETRNDNKKTTYGVGGRYIEARLQESFGSDYQLSSQASSEHWITEMEMPLMIPDAGRVSDTAVNSSHQLIEDQL